MLSFHATLVTLTVLAQPAASDTVTPAQARKVVERSLPFVREEGIQWIHRRQCHSCHHVGFMVWTLNEASQHGYTIDRQELKHWANWAVDYASYKGTIYQMKDPTFAALAKAGFPDDKLAKLKDIKQAFITTDAMRDELKIALPEELLNKHQDLIVKTATKNGVGGQGEDNVPTNGPGTVASELLFAGAPSLTAGPAEATKALVERLVKTQKKDGSWKHGGQFDAFKRSAKESTDAVTAWNALALIAYDAPTDAAAVKTRDQALAYLKDVKPGESTDSHVVQLLLAHALKNSERTNALLKELREQQLSDGSWAWLKGNKNGDAWATGEALYALGVVGTSHTDPSVQRAWSFLKKTQREDGDWLVSTANIRKAGAKKTTDPIFSYWGTAWAAIGIMKTLPKEVAK
jgi:squalene-hopene/tetraprenyl-beta-curcumene cyclase